MKAFIVIASTVAIALVLVFALTRHDGRCVELKDGRTLCGKEFDHWCQRQMPQGVTEPSFCDSLLDTLTQ